MKVVVAVIVVGCVVSFVGLGLTKGEAAPRPLSDAEMKAIVGGIGDGCPCNYQEADSECKGTDGCLTCVVWKKGEDQKACPKDGFQYSQNDRTVCKGEQTNPKTCYWSPLEQNCKRSWWCTSSGEPLLGYKCDDDGDQKICIIGGPEDQYCQDCMRKSAAGEWSTYYNENCL